LEFVVSLTIHYAKGHSPVFCNGIPEGGLVDRVSGFTGLPDGARQNHPVIRAALESAPEGVSIDFSGDSISFQPPIAVVLVHRVGDAVLNQLAATVAA